MFISLHCQPERESLTAELASMLHNSIYFVPSCTSSVFASTCSFDFLSSLSDGLLSSTGSPFTSDAPFSASLLLSFSADGWISLLFQQSFQYLAQQYSSEKRASSMSRVHMITRNFYLGRMKMAETREILMPATIKQQFRQLAACFTYLSSFDVFICALRISAITMHWQVLSYSCSRSYGIPSGS